MDRRSLLKLGLGQVGLAAISGLGLSGCQSDPNAPQILGLKGAIPPQLIKAFHQRSDPNSPAAHLAFQTRGQMQLIFSQLQDWKRQTTGLMQIPKPWLSLPKWGAKDPSDKNKPQLPELVSLGDYWLTVAIAQGLIQPISTNQLQNWSSLDDRWKQLVSRNDKGELDGQGQVWGVPYRWGATVIAYRRDLFEQYGLKPPQDWTDLFRPELKGRISLLDSPRETIGLALKYLGQSYNSADLGAINNLESTLTQLHQQAKFYSSDAYLQPLLLGDTWLAVGWSSDLLPQLRTSPTLEMIVPQSGSALWADLWVRPQGLAAPTQNMAYTQWIDFCLSGEISHRLALLSRAGSPLTQRAVAAAGVMDGDRNPLLNLPDSIWQKSETLQPLDRAKAEQYRSLWAKVRQ